MDTQRMADATKFHRLAVTLTFDPSAERAETWLACIGFDCYGAGSTPEEALAAAMNREALGPEPIYPGSEDGDDPDPLPFDDVPKDEFGWWDEEMRGVACHVSLAGSGDRRTFDPPHPGESQPASVSSDHHIEDPLLLIGGLLP